MDEVPIQAVEALKPKSLSDLAADIEMKSDSEDSSEDETEEEEIDYEVMPISIYFGKSYSVHYIPSATQGTRKHITTTTKFGTNIHNIKNI